MKQIEAVIFDWAGTTVDYGCMAPIHAMIEAFKSKEVIVTLDEIRKPMGMLKLDHIEAVLNMDRVRTRFNQVHGRQYDQTDIEIIYNYFESKIFKILHQHTKLIDGLLEVQTHLRKRDIKIGSTTGYTTEMIKIVADGAASQGYLPDTVVAADQVQRGRPYPYMMYQNMTLLEVQNINQVVKVGDTIVDIQEGINAGCWSVGVVKGGSMLGMSEEETAKMEAGELTQRVRQIRYEMLAAGADYVIDSLHELPWVIDLIQQKINH
jgi:phosphonoacetaldehyde hydrolase